MIVDGNIYTNDLRTNFEGNNVEENQIEEVFDFSYDMVFADGHHRHYRSGGSHNRKKGELFANTFQGKLAETCAHIFFSNLVGAENVSPLDFSIHGKNISDDGDFKVNNKELSIKSAAYFSNLLLLEQKDYNNNGEYIPNIDSDKNTIIDFFVLVRLSPDIKKIMKSNRLFFAESIDKEELRAIVANEEWVYDIPGFITHNDLLKAIQNEQIIPKGALLNNSTTMDANNYYFETGALNADFDMFM